jgi:hypothetical protein
VHSESVPSSAPAAFVLRAWQAHTPDGTPVWRIRAQRVNQDAPRVFDSWPELAAWLEREAIRAQAARLSSNDPEKGDAS